jgi:hypothetical protein
MVARRYTAEVREVCIFADVSTVPARASQYRARLDMILVLLLTALFLEIETITVRL